MEFSECIAYKLN